jgi:hypothetical protein
MNESPYVKICLKKVEEKLGWGEVAHWTDIDFRNLSNIIDSSSGILVSSHTLKRLFGKIKYNSNYNPQIATKEALAKYLGYESWNDFKEDLSKEVSVKNESLNPISQVNKKPPLILSRIVYLSIPAFLIIVSIAFYFLWRTYELGPYNFQVQNPVGKAPHTATFNYDISQIGTKNVFIDFDHFSNNGVYLTTNLDQDSGRLSRCFHFPGKYDVKLFANERVIQQIPVLVESDNWFFYAIEPYSVWDLIPDVIKPTVSKRHRLVKFDNILYGDFINEGYMHIPPSNVGKIEGLTSNFKTHYVLTRYFNVPLDNCIFEIRFRNEGFGGGIQCNEASFELIGMIGSLSFQVVEPGCLNYAFLRIGKVFKFGENENLEEFEMNFLDFRTLKVHVDNARITLYREEEEFYSIDYDGSLGELVGIHLSSKGTPHYDWLKISDPNGNVVYNENFDE